MFNAQVIDYSNPRPSEASRERVGASAWLSLLQIGDIVRLLAKREKYHSIYTCLIMFVFMWCCVRLDFYVVDRCIV